MLKNFRQSRVVQDALRVGHRSRSATQAQGSTRLAEKEKTSHDTQRRAVEFSPRTTTTNGRRDDERRHCIYDGLGHGDWWWLDCWTHDERQRLVVTHVPVQTAVLVSSTTIATTGRRSATTNRIGCGSVLWPTCRRPN